MEENTQDTTSQDTTKKTMKVPKHEFLGQAKLHNGEMVHIMTHEQWTKYCYHFNKLNNLQMPEMLET